jgi:small subunit ribosomal protein S1
MPNNTTLDQDQTPTTPERGEDFGDILSQYEQSHSHRPEAGGQGLEGTVVAISPEQVFFDIGQKIEGVMPAAEFRDPAGKVNVRVGDKFPVSIKGHDEEGYYLLSKVRVERPKDWSSLEAAFNEKRNIAGVVTGVVKGGLSVDVGVRAFMPASRSGAKDPVEMEKLVGQEITCRIIKVDVADEDVVVDRRVVLEEEETAAR